MLPVIMLTDFGLADDFAGTCHAVILRRCPGAQVVHLTHGITRQHVLQGALVMRNSLPYMPVAVHLAVVDPGVGTTRRAIALTCADGRAFVGPDNGLLIPAAEAAGGIVAVHEINDARFILQPLSATFHGRDIFAPAAAHLAGGGDLSDLGTAVDPATLVRLDIPEPTPISGGIVAEVWDVDSFGNISLHVSEDVLSAVLGGGDRAELTARADRYFVDVARTFASVRPGGLLLFVDAWGGVSLAVNRGNAAAMFRLKPGDTVEIRPVAAAEPIAVDLPAARAMVPRSR